MNPPPPTPHSRQSSSPVSPAAAAAKSLHSVRPHRWQPTRLPRAWDSPGKNTGLGCHFLLQCMTVKSESEVAQSLSRVRLVATPWTAAYQAPPPTGFSRQEYWSGMPLPSPATFNSFRISQLLFRPTAIASAETSLTTWLDSCSRCLWVKFCPTSNYSLHSQTSLSKMQHIYSSG